MWVDVPGGSRVVVKRSGGANMIVGPQDEEAKVNDVWQTMR